jgi:hypothetical protein
MSLHRQRIHPTYIEGCFGCKVGTLQMAPSVASSTVWGARAKADKEREKRWGVDMPAYKRLREQGYQPPRIDGSAHLETHAETRFEIESGRVHDQRQLAEAISIVEDSTNRSVFEPVTKPNAVTP